MNSQYSGTSSSIKYIFLSFPVSPFFSLLSFSLLYSSVPYYEAMNSQYSGTSSSIKYRLCPLPLSCNGPSIGKHVHSRYVHALLFYLTMTSTHYLQVPADNGTSPSNRSQRTLDSERDSRDRRKAASDTIVTAVAELSDEAANLLTPYIQLDPKHRRGLAYSYNLAAAGLQYVQ
jgi:hypothetical protein